MPWMLDTHICIYLMKQQPPQVIARLEALREGEAVMSVVTYAELRAGLEMLTEGRAREALAGGGATKVWRGRYGRVLHPSPASPAANRGWAEAATRELVAQGVWQG